MKASGIYVPALVIFPRKNMSLNLTDGTPAESVWACHSSKWVQGDIFAKWLNHFIQLTRTTASNLFLLVLDSHYNHAQNVDVIDMARENHGSIVSLPPHSAHNMQPLDI